MAETDGGKKILPGLVRPRLLSLRKPSTPTRPSTTLQSPTSALESIPGVIPSEMIKSIHEAKQSNNIDVKPNTLLPMLSRLQSQKTLNASQIIGKKSSNLIEPLQMKIADDEHSKRPGMLRIKITDQVITKRPTNSPNETALVPIRPVLTPGRLSLPKVPIIRKQLPIKTYSKTDNFSASEHENEKHEKHENENHENENHENENEKEKEKHEKIPKGLAYGTPKTVQKVLGVPKPNKTSNVPKVTKNVIKDISDLLEEREREAAEAAEAADSEEEGEAQKVNNPYMFPNPMLGCSSYRIMTESRVKKELFATPDTEPVILVPIVIANHVYLICHQNQCLYSPENDEKIGIIQADRSIIWYSRKT